MRTRWEAGLLVLQHEGQWFYYLGDHDAAGHLNNAREVPERLSPHADGEPMRRLLTPGWWAADRQAALITVRRPRSPETTGYRLRDPKARSARFPAELTVGQWRERIDDQDEEVLWELYEAVEQAQPDEVVRIEGPWRRLDAAPPPPPDDRRTWTADLPYVLSGRAEYAHLFPGYMEDFPQRLVQTLERLPGVRHVFDRTGWGGGVVVVLQVPAQEPGTVRPDLRPGGDLGRADPAQVLVRREVQLQAPGRIAGESRADAAAEWDRLMDRCVQAVRQVGVAACGQCQGKGHLPQGPSLVEL